MFNFCSLYSGSSGNCLFVETDNSKILIDAGMSTKKIVEALDTINVNPNEIDAILITHEHVDHTKGLGLLSKKYNIPVFANKETWDSILTQREKIDIDNQRFFNVSKKFEINDIEISPFSIPHDAINPCGFNIYNNNYKISIATDIGHMTKDILSNLERSSFIMLESNYDPEVLRCCSYPYHLKTRIAGPNGHLPNNVAGKTLAHLIDFGLKDAVLGHLSKENNFPELAYKTVIEELLERNFNENSINLSVAHRDKPTNIFKIS